MPIPATQVHEYQLWSGRTISKTMRAIAHTTMPTVIVAESLVLRGSGSGRRCWVTLSA
ncbi:hypothetical protein [Herbidospora yilanensis]|uniref:hypothetical protein n=1 Tax=Herbidospora yilanensis TaxID=354426 RepID=UPI000B0E03DC|nr:hypothetical protein [Herbidospora yilanensis]